MLSYLALGDSYTIGEGVALFQSFPYQLVQLLRSGYYDCNAPEIIAKTGWTTSELQSNMKGYLLNSSYDFATLLVGVNNQFRGGSIEEFSQQFSEILSDAISLVSFKRSNLYVLSIPDWGLTDFARDRDRLEITRQISMFNHLIAEIVEQEGVEFIDITTEYTATLYDSTLLAEDGLHPSPAEYARWANLLFERISKKFL